MPARDLLLQVAEAVIAVPVENATDNITLADVTRLQLLLNSLLKECFGRWEDGINWNDDAISDGASALKLLQCVLLRLPHTFASPLPSDSERFGDRVLLRLLSSLTISQLEPLHSHFVQNLALLVTFQGKRGTALRYCNVAGFLDVYLSALGVRDSAFFHAELEEALSYARRHSELLLVCKLNAVLYLLVLQSLPGPPTSLVCQTWLEWFPLFLLSLPSATGDCALFLFRLMDGAFDFLQRLFDLNYFVEHRGRSYALLELAFTKHCLFSLEQLETRDNLECAAAKLYSFSTGLRRRGIRRIESFSLEIFDSVPTAERVRCWPLTLQNAYVDLLPSLRPLWSGRDDPFLAHLSTLCAEAKNFNTPYIVAQSVLQSGELDAAFPPAADFQSANFNVGFIFGSLLAFYRRNNLSLIGPLQAWLLEQATAEKGNKGLLLCRLVQFSLHFSIRVECSTLISSCGAFIETMLQQLLLRLDIAALNAEAVRLFACCFALPYLKRCDDVADVWKRWQGFVSKCRALEGNVAAQFDKEVFLQGMLPWLPLVADHLGKRIKGFSHQQLRVLVTKENYIFIAECFYQVFSNPEDPLDGLNLVKVLGEGLKADKRFPYTICWSDDFKAELKVQKKCPYSQAYEFLQDFVVCIAELGLAASAATLSPHGERLIVELIALAHKGQTLDVWSQPWGLSLVAQNLSKFISESPLLLRLLPVGETEWQEVVGPMLFELETNAEGDLCLHFIDLLARLVIRQLTPSSDAEVSVSLVEWCFLKLISLAPNFELAVYQALFQIRHGTTEPLRRIVAGFGEAFCTLVLRDDLWLAALPLLDLQFDTLCRWQTSAMVYVAVIDNSLDLLTKVSSSLQKEPSVLLVEEMPFVLSQIFIQKELNVPKALNQCLEMIEIAVSQERDSHPETAPLSQTSNESTCRQNNANVGRLSLSDVINTCHIRLVTYLAIELGDTDPERRHRAFLGLKLVQSRLQNQKSAVGVSSESEIGRDDGVAWLLDQNLLAILAKVNERLARIGTSSVYANSVTVKEVSKAVNSLTYIFVQAPQGINLVFTQILATLQTALASTNRSIRMSALSSWKSLIKYAPWSSVEQNGLTIACILVYYYQNLTPDEQTKIDDSLALLFDQQAQQAGKQARNTRRTSKASKVSKGQGGRILSSETLSSLKVLLHPSSSPALALPLGGAVESSFICISDDGGEEGTQEAFSSASSSIVQRLSKFVQLLDHEHSLVIYFALERLCSFLQAERLAIGELLLMDSLPPTLNRLLETLLIVCREHAGDSRISIYCCRNLGLLGAIEPSRVSVCLRAEPYVVLDNFESPGELLDFVFHLISKILAPAFKRSRTSRMQAHTSFAIQELLKISKITPGSVAAHRVNKENAGEVGLVPAGIGSAVDSSESYSDAVCRKWSQLPASVAEIITPLLTSKYSLQATNRLAEKYPMFPRSETFKDWLQGFTLDLILRLDRDHPAEPVFRACRSALNCEDLAIARFLLPHVFLANLYADSQNGDLIREYLLLEICSVLQAVVGDDDPIVSVDVVDTCADEKAQLASQVVYDLLDRITMNVRLQKQKQGSEVNSRQRTAIARLQEFTDSVSQELLAKASLRCQSYARSLMHLEQHMRAKKLLAQDHGSEIKESILELTAQGRSELRPLYGQLERVYALMDESDCVAGVIAMVVTPTLQEQVLEFETLGDWTSAQSCYELAVQQNANNYSFHVGLMNSLRQLGHYESMLAHARHLSLSCNIPYWKQAANSFAIEASWRLGQWKEAAEYLEQPYQEKFEVNVGQLILAANAKTESTFDSLRDELLQKLAVKLSATSMESYHRCYSVLLQLHMLEELASAYNESDEAYKQSRWWDLRLKILQNTVKASEPILSLRRSILLSKAIRHSNLTGSEAPVTNAYETTIGSFGSGVISRTVQALGSQASVAIETLGHLWLQSAKLSRKAGYFQTSLNSFLYCKSLLETSTVELKGSQRFSLALTHLERGKWFWCQGQTHKALFELDAALLFKDSTDKELAAKIELLLARWTEETSISHSNAILKRYGKMCELMPHWEKSFYFVGRYYDKLFENERAKDFSVGNSSEGNYRIGRGTFPSSSASGTALDLGSGSLGASAGSQKAIQLAQQKQLLLAQYIYKICRNYGKALENGQKYVYQSLPRLLTLWLDFENLVFFNAGRVDTSQPSDAATGVAGATGGREKGGVTAGSRSSTAANISTSTRDDVAVKRMNDLNKVMSKWVQTLPTFLFLQAFPQLISRIGHPNPVTFAVLEQILIKTLCTYPQQALWQMMSLYKSNHDIRNHRCLAIFRQAAALSGKSPSKSLPLTKLIEQFTRVTDNLVRLANYSVDSRKQSLSLRAEFAPLVRMTPLDMVIPLQSCMQASRASLQGHSSSDFPTIQHFNDRVEVIRSMQLPRKIKITGSDGRVYPFLCKARDDLRKDNRLMECNSMLNSLLKRNAETRRRRLAIRTYSVVPLNEECGLIEWVNNTVGFRHIVMELYNQHQQGMSLNDINALYQQKGLSAYDRFVKRLLPRHPPVFHEWFISQFPEPTRWFASRYSYASTLAVMSMVGYILGLGDRHGQNILFDETCGDVLHVDFGCLFEKGLTLAYPEKVPFRLTHNMVDALGVTGVEGVFRVSCQATLSLLRENKDSIMSLLETFIHDPLVEWGRPSSKNNRLGNLEVMNHQARKHLTVIDKKLQGILNPGLPLSVPGQVHELIQQATSVSNLSVMFFGWGAYH